LGQRWHEKVLGASDDRTDLLQRRQLCAQIMAEQTAELPLYRRRRVRLPLPQRFHHRDDARWIEKICREAHHLQGPRQIELADSRLVRCEQSLHNAAQAWTRRSGRGHQGGVTEALGMSHQCVLRPHSPHRKAGKIHHRQPQRV